MWQRSSFIHYPWYILSRMSALFGFELIFSNRTVSFPLYCTIVQSCNRTITCTDKRESTTADQFGGKCWDEWGKRMMRYFFQIFTGCFRVAKKNILMLSVSSEVNIFKSAWNLKINCVCNFEMRNNVEIMPLLLLDK